MPPQLASLLSWLFIGFLFKRDFKQTTQVSRALWLPTLWLGINCSRFVSQWLAMFGIQLGAGSLEEGTPVDAFWYLILITAGINVLRKRGVTLETFARYNTWLLIYLAYSFISIAWSDLPFVSFKRWYKTLGHPVMALIILTEADPKAALSIVMRRCSYVLIIISVLFIKYYPHWGRGFSSWTGEAMNYGITLDKNKLGVLCLLTGYFFTWRLLIALRAPKGNERRDELRLCVCFLSLIWWLMTMANSKTALMSLVIGMTVLLISEGKFMRNRKHLLGAVVLFALIVGGGLELMFDLYESVIILLGRNPNLTERTILWGDVLRLADDPLLGTGFENFWMGERMRIMTGLHKWGPNQCHNGYLETYVNLGAVGFVLMLMMLVSCWRKASRHVSNDYDFGRFRLGFLLAVLFYNWTEASFKALHPVWSMFYIAALDYPRIQSKALSADTSGDDADESSGSAVAERSVAELVLDERSAPMT